MQQHLVYVNPIGENSNGEYEYEFFFSEDPETVWAEDWNEPLPKFCDTMPYDVENLIVKRLTSTILFFCAQQNTCFPMNYAKIGIISLAHEDISEYEEYPEPYRIVFQYGEDMVSVVEKLHGRGEHFKKDEEEKS